MVQTVSNGHPVAPNFRAIFEASPTPFIVVSPPDWTIVAANDARLRVTSTTREEQIGRKLFDAFPDDPDDPSADGVQKLSASLERVMATKSTDVMAIQRYAVRDANGLFVERWWSPVNTPVLSQDGDVQVIIHWVEDVTDLVRLRGEATASDQLARDQVAVIDRLRASEGALVRSEGRYRQIVEGAEDFAIVTFDGHGIITGWNHGAERITGFLEAAAIGQPGDIFFTKADRDSGLADHEMNRAHVEGRAINERWHQRADGSRFWGSGLMMRLEDGGYLKIFRDRTSEHEAEVRREALISLADALRELHDGAEIAHAASKVLGETLAVSRVGYAAIDHDAETLHTERDWTAPEVESLAGVLSLRVYGSFIDSLKQGEFTVIPDVREDPRTSGEAAEALEGKSSRSFVNAPILEHGRLVAVFFVNSAEVRNWSQGDLELITEFAERTRTAVERARGERALRELNETLEAQVAARSAERDRVWNLSQDMFARANYDGMMLAVSPAWTQILGWRETELLSRGYAAFMHPDDASHTLDAIAGMAESQQPTRFENRIATREGGWKFIEWTVAPEADGLHFIAVGRDLSLSKVREAELEDAQEALRQSQKMEAVGQLTGGIAHDFNNLLAGITGSLEIIDKRLSQGRVEGLDRFIEGARSSAQRAASLTQRLLAFSRRQTLDPKPTDVNRLVQGMEDLIGRTVGPAIIVKVSCATELWSTKVDAAQLENALLNLAINSRDAMPGGGSILIETANAVFDEPAARDRGLKPGEYISISVTDTGTGIPKDIADRIFDPFFTTKPIGQGTGLGLSMIHGFLQQSGGQVKVGSEAGMGTTMSLYLPRYAGSVVEDAEDSGVAIAAIGEGETILVIDDEPIVRMLIVEALEDAGYTPLEADDGPSGLIILRSDARIDLLITDVGLPGGMNGRQVADAARITRPDLKVLFVTGYAENAAI